LGITGAHGQREESIRAVPSHVLKSKGVPVSVVQLHRRAQLLIWLTASQCKSKSLVTGAQKIRASTS
jgi:hypothetical protein